MKIRRTALFTSLLLGLSLTYGCAYADQATSPVPDSPEVASNYESLCKAGLGQFKDSSDRIIREGARLVIPLLARCG